MTNPSHYVSLEVAQELLKAGIEFEGSELVWCNPKGSGTRIELPMELISRVDSNDFLMWIRAFRIPAPSFMEIMDELPEEYVVEKTPSYTKLVKERNITIWNCYFTGFPARGHNEKALTAPDAAAKMRIKLKEEE